MNKHRLSFVATGGRWTLTALLVLASAWTGYSLRGIRADAASSSGARALPGLEMLASPETYSRVKNAKNTLDALCTRLRLEMQRGIVASDSFAAGTPSRQPAIVLDALIRDVKRAMQESEGTDRQLYFAHDLLVALKRAGRNDEWMDVYLSALYEQPLHPVVGLAARDAVAQGRATGRVQEVLTAFQHLLAIPGEFRTKENIQIALFETEPCEEFTQITGNANPL